MAEVDRAGKGAAGDAGQKIQRAIDDDGTCNAGKSAGTTRDGLRFGKDQVRELQPQHFSCGAGKDLITVGRRPCDRPKTLPRRRVYGDVRSVLELTEMGAIACPNQLMQAALYRFRRL